MDKVMLEKYKQESDSSEISYCTALRQYILGLLILLPSGSSIKLEDIDHEGGLGGFKYTGTMPCIDIKGEGFVYTNPDCYTKACSETTGLDSMNSVQLQKVVQSIEAHVLGTIYTVVYHSFAGEIITPYNKVYYSWAEVRDMVQREVDNMNVGKRTCISTYTVPTILLGDWFSIMLDDVPNAEYFISAYVVDKDKIK